MSYAHDTTTFDLVAEGNTDDVLDAAEAYVAAHHVPVVISDTRGRAFFRYEANGSPAEWCS